MRQPIFGQNGILINIRLDGEMQNKGTLVKTTRIKNVFATTPPFLMAILLANFFLILMGQVIGI